MSKVRCKILKIDEYTKLTGEHPKSDIIQIAYKDSIVLIKRGIVELSELQREVEGKKEEIILIDKSSEVIEFLKNPTLLENLISEVQKIAVGETRIIKTLLIIFALSKVRNKRPASTNICLHATSGAGKDFIVGETVKLLPEQYVFMRRRISQRALDYALAQYQTRDWNLYFVFLEDINHAIANSESCKTLMSAAPDKINTVSIVHEGAIKNLNIRGKPTFIMTSASAKSTDEILRRLPFCSMDETPEQTLQINLRQAWDDSTIQRIEQNKIAKKFYLGLEQKIVIIPKEIGKLITTKLAEAWIKQSKRCQVIQRTIFPRFLDYIKGSACLYQYQREQDAEGNVIAKFPDDYNNARECLLQTTSNSLMIPINREERELIELLLTKFPMGATTKEISIHFSKFSERHLYSVLDRLCSLGFLEKQSWKTEESDKRVARYIPQKGVLEFSIPTWDELIQQNISNASNASNTSFPSIPSNGKELKQLNATVIEKNAKKAINQTNIYSFCEKSPIGKNNIKRNSNANASNAIKEVKK